ncbi:hypothetical protein BDZ94DRAFT_1309136 [Collybia nuda]|uniref:Uncharacterized protein n=1 Tax=Collybia nuda TaxID=64659 RepID=A0A9P6CEM5_9AGAR|nr:hypothetical protein BDZ94DRAFT_1309136 [Collybia nuda]
MLDRTPIALSLKPTFSTMASTKAVLPFLVKSRIGYSTLTLISVWVFPRVSRNADSVKKSVELIKVTFDTPSPPQPHHYGVFHWKAISVLGDALIGFLIFVTGNLPLFCGVSARTTNFLVRSLIGLCEPELNPYILKGRIIVAP